MKYLYLFIIAVFALAIILYSRQTQPFAITEDMAAPADFRKTGEVNEKDTYYGFLQYTRETKKRLAAADERILRPFRCSERIIRNEQGVFILEFTKTQTRQRQRVLNDEFIEFMRNKEPYLPQGKKILTARVCELNNGTLLLFYSIGVYEMKTADAITTNKAIVYSKKNTAYLQFFPAGIFAGSTLYEIAKSGDHIRCDQPFHIDKDNNLTMLCVEEADWSANSYVYQVNLKNATAAILNKCMNRFENKVESKCD